MQRVYLAVSPCLLRLVILRKIDAGAHAYTLKKYFRTVCWKVQQYVDYWSTLYIDVLYVFLRLHVAPYKSIFKRRFNDGTCYIHRLAFVTGKIAAVFLSWGIRRISRISLAAADCCPTCLEGRRL